MSAVIGAAKDRCALRCSRWRHERRGAAAGRNRPSLRKDSLRMHFRGSSYPSRGGDRRIQRDL